MRKYGSIANPVVASPGVDSISLILNRSKRPVVLIGAEDLSRECAASLSRLIDVLQIPFITTYRAKGIVDENHALSLGAAGLSPVVDDVQQSFLKEADAILLIGFDMVEMRPNWLEGWLEHADVISMSTLGQIDIPTTLTVDWRGNIAEGLNALKDHVRRTIWAWTLKRYGFIRIVGRLYLSQRVYLGHSIQHVR